ncbi:hypothetical protein GCM10022396_33850 [Flavivirga amylovorans]
MLLFLCLALLCLAKNAASEQILSHFRLKTKSQDEFNKTPPLSRIERLLVFLYYYHYDIPKNLNNFSRFRFEIGNDFLLIISQ